MQFTTVWSKKKYYDIYLKSEKLVHSQQEHEKNDSRSKEKDYDIYIKSEKLVHSQLEYEKNVSQLFGSGKNRFLAISSLTNTVAAIWREKSASLLFGDQKMQFRTVRSKEKDYDIYLK